MLQVVVVGDAGSGKSSLVCAMGQRPPPTSKVVEELRFAVPLSSAACVCLKVGRIKVQDDTRLHVMDTDAETGGFEDALAGADVVVLVYRVDGAGALDEAVATWLPRAAGKNGGDGN